VKLNQSLIPIRVEHWVEATHSLAELTQHCCASLVGAVPCQNVLQIGKFLLDLTPPNRPNPSGKHADQRPNDCITQPKKIACRHCLHGLGCKENVPVKANCTKVDFDRTPRL
jgi:hypothetical protein